MPDPPDELLEELRGLFAKADPVPPDVTEFATTALGWRRLDAELAELLDDSLLEAPSAAGTRGATAAERWLTFRATDLAIDVELQSDGETRTLLGQLAPTGPATIEAQATDGSVAATAEADSLGRFRLTLTAGGRVRLRVLRPDRAQIETSWLPL
jgi:hypothetical protein